MGRIGAPVVQSCSIAPYRSRVVQFASYLDASSSDWRLTWMGGRERLPDVAWENNERRSVVELAEPGKVANYSGTSGQFSRFPGNEFPGNPGVMEALAGGELLAVIVISASVIFGLYLITDLSLFLRWGAFPVAIVICSVLWLLFGLFMLIGGQRGGGEGFLVVRGLL